MLVKLFLLSKSQSMDSYVELFDSFVRLLLNIDKKVKLINGIDFVQLSSIQM